jgi:hypothetical protein
MTQHSYIHIQFVPHREQCPLLRTDQLKLFREIIAAYCEDHTKHTHVLCGQNAEFLDVTAGGAHSYHYALNSCIYIHRNEQNGHHCICITYSDHKRNRSDHTISAYKQNGHTSNKAARRLTDYMLG